LSNDTWSQRAAQYGTFDRLDYSLDGYYESQAGDFPNTDLELRSLSLATRAQLSAQDTLFVQVVDTRFASGDTRQYYDPAGGSATLRVEERQSPNVFAGFHHAWSPGAHTLLLVSRLEDDFQLSDTAQFIPTLTTFFGNINGQVLPGFSLFTNRQHADFTAWSAELQHIQQTERNTLIVGGRYQAGQNETRVQLDHNTTQTLGQTYPAGAQSADTDLRRASVYAYDHLQVSDSLRLIGGVSCDWLDYPANIDLPPITRRRASCRRRWE
jgi:outer membrane receptor for monomeric catechols